MPPGWKAKATHLAADSTHITELEDALGLAAARCEYLCEIAEIVWGENDSRLQHVFAWSDVVKTVRELKERADRNDSMKGQPHD
jgi:hypothetical protein